MDDVIKKLLSELAIADERRKRGLEPRNKEEAYTYFELLVLHSVLDNLTLVVEEEIDFSIPDTVPIEWF